MNEDNTQEEICKCGHKRKFHIQGIGGCLYNKENEKTGSIIYDFSKCDCECNKFKKLK